MNICGLGFVLFLFVSRGQKQHSAECIAELAFNKKKFLCFSGNKVNWAEEALPAGDKVRNGPWCLQEIVAQAGTNPAELALLHSAPPRSCEVLFLQTNQSNQLTKQMNKTHLQLRRNKANRLQERKKMCIIASVHYYSSLARTRTMFQLTGSVQISGSILFLFLWDYTHSCIQQFKPHFSSQPLLATAVPFFSSTALDLTMLSDSEVRNHTLTSC